MLEGTGMVDAPMGRSRGTAWTVAAGRAVGSGVRLASFGDLGGFAGGAEGVLEADAARAVGGSGGSTTTGAAGGGCEARGSLVAGETAAGSATGSEDGNAGGAGGTGAGGAASGSAAGAGAATGVAGTVGATGAGAAAEAGAGEAVLLGGASPVTRHSQPAPGAAARQSHAPSAETVCRPWQSTAPAVTKARRRKVDTG
jgi:hypothetical protein